MIHISDMSWNRIKHPSVIVNVGDTVEATVKTLDKENKKVNLTLKKIEDNPWEILKRDYPIGSIIEARIVSIATFGAFANILPSIDGLIHISQISHDRIKAVADVLEIGQQVDVQIIDVDYDKKRVSLSIKSLIEKPEEVIDELVEEVPAEETVEVEETPEATDAE